MLEKIQKKIQILKKEAKQKKKKISLVITVTTHPSNEKIKVYPTRFLDKYICLPIGIKNDKTAIRLAKYFDGKVDVIFVDIENKLKTCKNILEKVANVVTKTKIYGIKGNDFSADATFALISTILGNVSRKKICIIGAGNIGSKVALKLVESGAHVYIINSTKNSSLKIATAINILKPIECIDKVIPISKEKLPSQIDCVVGFTRGIPVITKKIVLKIKNRGFILDGGLGTISQDGFIEARKKQLKILKVDIRMGFVSSANLMINTEKLIDIIGGMKKIGKFRIVAGGTIGEKGDVVVNDLHKPTQILGIADGKGGMSRETKNFKDEINRISKILEKKKV